MVRERLALLLPDMGGGGAERVALTLINHFIAKGYAVDLLLMRAHGEFLSSVPPQVKVIDLGAARIRDAIMPVARYLARVRPAAMQISMWPLTVAAIIAKRLGRSDTRIVVSDHSALSSQYGNRGVWHRRLLSWSIRLIYPLADARVAVASATARELSELSGLPAEDFEVIYNPVEVPNDGPADPEVAGLWEDAKFRILNVGRLTPEKNQLLLLEAFASLPFVHQSRLIILGEGNLRGHLQRRAEELGIAGRVAMPGFRPDPSPFYRSANLFVLSSDFEGYPLVIIEAMHCGLTVASTACPTGPAEILKDGEFGYLARCGNRESLAEAISASLARPIDRQKLQHRAHALSTDAADRYLALMVAEKTGLATDL